MNKIKRYKLPKDCSLGLKVVWADGRPEYKDAPEGFRWNLTPGGWTEAPDWEAGGGLHVWHWAGGDLSTSAIWDQWGAVRWLAVEYRTEDATSPIDGVVKVPKCRTVAAGTEGREIAEFIHKFDLDCENYGFLFEVKGSANSHVEVADGGTATTGDECWAFAGYCGTAIAGDGGEAYAGHKGFASAGCWGSAKAGDYGTAKALYGGRAAVGKGGTILLAFDYNVVTLREGVDGIEPDIYYELDENHRPVVADNADRGELNLILEHKHRLFMLPNYQLPPGCKLGLKAVSMGGRSESDIETVKWALLPDRKVEAPDWDPTPKAGGGLHVWEWACGNLGVSDIWEDTHTIWLVVEYDMSVPLRGMVKVPKCRTVAVGRDKQALADFVRKYSPLETQESSFFRVFEAGKGGRNTGRDGDTVIAGDKGIARAGKGGTAIAGDGGRAVSGVSGVSKAGDRGHARSGLRGRAVAGFGGVAEAGDAGYARAGDGGRAAAGAWGQAVVGNNGCASAGINGEAKAGVGGTIVLMHLWRGEKTFVIGENGIKPDTFYELDDSGNLVEGLS